MRAADLELVGGHVVVDFVNTVGGSEADPEELLHSYADALAWAEHAGVVPSHRAATLSALAGERASAAGGVFADVRHLRGHVDVILRAHVGGEPPPTESLEVVLNAYLKALRHARLDPAAAPHGWVWDDPDQDLSSVLWPIAAEAMDLLRSDLLERLASCAGCRWLFLDHSRNRSRRWCTMNTCGASAKMRRYRAARRP